MNTSVLGAVFKRNFVSYFANPTGYVFLCVFVLLSGVAAFWPPEFFNSNLASLHQLNRFFPYIMLVFIPAITMAIWADERRQGTDELLLTIPGNDLDIVLGKYLATVAVFSVSLLFSLVCNFLVLRILGNPNTGLFLGSYFGYWLIGLAMLALGMVASFLTSNLTVAYILGALLNVPLVFLAQADVIFKPEQALSLKDWSIGERFYDFGQGVISLSGLTYFLMIVVVMAYVSVLLIGRRHWLGGQKSGSLFVHYLVRVLALVGLAVGLSLIFHYRDGRLDITAERLSSLSPETVKLLKNLDVKRPIQIEAFVSATVPESYVQPRLNLLAMLRELQARAGDKVRIVVNNTERFSEEAARAEQRYDIRPREVRTLNRGAYQVDHVFMGVAFTYGMEKVILPFIDRGIPVEYELIRSLCTVAPPVDLLGVSVENAKGGVKVAELTPGSSADKAGLKSGDLITQLDGKPVADRGAFTVAMAAHRADDTVKFAVQRGAEKLDLSPRLARRKRVGVLQTDAHLYGQFNFQMMSSSGNWPIIEELEKQYEVVQVDPASPITEKYDVLLAVQPSSLGPEQMDNFIRAVESGQPTAIFEDPFPRFIPSVPGTKAPRTPPQGMDMMMGMRQQQPPQPKGDIDRLWRTLGVDFNGDQVIWQKYNPYPKIEDFQREPEFVFVDQGELAAQASAGEKPFNDKDAISSQLQQLLFPFPGSINKLQASSLQFTPLVTTGHQTGVVECNDIMPMSPFGARGGDVNEHRRLERTGNGYVLAAHIHGKIKPSQPMADEAPPATDKPATDKPATDKPAADKPATDKPATDKPAEGKPEEKPSADKPSADKPAEGKPEGQPEEKPAAMPKLPQESEINVVLVGDIDMLSPAFFRIREQGNTPEAGVNFEFDNVTFILNTLDELAGDGRFIEIRNRRPQHRTLTTVEQKTDDKKRQAAEKREEFIKNFKDELDRERKSLEKSVADLKKRKDANMLEIQQELELIQETGNQRLQARTEQLERERDRQIDQIETDLNVTIRKVQDWYKFWAVALPPIPPLLVGLAVFFTRRAREREGVARSRLR